MSCYPAISSSARSAKEIINQPGGRGDNAPPIKNKQTMEDKKETTQNGGVTPEQIEGWKQLHGRVYEVEVEDPDTGETFKCYFKRPDMKTMEAANALSKQSEVKGSTVLFENCWLGGADAIKNDAIYKMEAMGALAGIFGKCVHRLKNL